MNQYKLIHTIRNWNISISDTDIKVDDGFISYYMNKRKAWDNFYPIPKAVVKWCETKGYQMLNQEER